MSSNALGLSEYASPPFPARPGPRYDASVQPLVKIDEVPSLSSVAPSSRPFVVAKTTAPAWQQAHSPTSSLPPSLHLVSPNLLPHNPIHSPVHDQREDRSPRFLNLQVSDLRQNDDAEELAPQLEEASAQHPEPESTVTSDGEASGSEIAVKALQALQERLVRPPHDEVLKVIAEESQHVKHESDTDSGYANVQSSKSSKSSTPSVTNGINDPIRKTPPALSPFSKYDDMSDTDDDELSADEFDQPEGKLRGKSRRDSSALQELPTGPVTEGDPSIRPYACNYPECIEKEEKYNARVDGTPMTGSSKDLEDEGESTCFSTIRELRNHNTQFHKEANADFVLPYRCALDCDKTFKSLAGLRWHFNNAASSGHLFVSMEPGEERPTKKFKTMSQRAERKERCPVKGCSKGFKQYAGLAYHLAHAPKHHVTEELFKTLDQRLASKLLWWYRKQGRPIPGESASNNDTKPSAHPQEQEEDDDDDGLFSDT